MRDVCVIGPQGRCKAVEWGDAMPAATSVFIAAAVGLNAVNNHADVAVIQRALNRVTPDTGGPIPLLAEDGISGPLTQRAIQRFQQRQFNWYDGRVDPGQKTIERLNAIVGGPGASSVSPLAATPTLMDKAEET